MRESDNCAHSHRNIGVKAIIQKKLTQYHKPTHASKRLMLGRPLATVSKPLQTSFVMTLGGAIFKIASAATTRNFSEKEAK